jgi:hypothetical protein
VFFAWLAGLWRHKEEDVLPPPPEPFETLSPEERERQHRAILEREAVLRSLEARARVKGNRRW